MLHCISRPFEHGGINAWLSDGAAAEGVLLRRASIASRTGARQNSNASLAAAHNNVEMKTG